MVLTLEFTRTLYYRLYRNRVTSTPLVFGIANVYSASRPCLLLERKLRNW